MAAGSNVLRRIARPPAPPSVLTPARALRLATIRAAERSVALPIAVLGVAEEEGPVGLVALDPESRAAIEAQTLGRVSPASPETRPATAADAALAQPLFSPILAEVEAALGGTSLYGWLRGTRLADPLPAAREAAMLLPDGRFRVVRLTLDLGAGGRQGLLVLMLRLPPPEPQVQAEAAQGNARGSGPRGAAPATGGAPPSAHPTGAGRVAGGRAD